MQSLEAACEEADHILHIARSRPHTVPHPKTSERCDFYDIHLKLRQLYETECARDSPNSHLKHSSHLINKLVTRDRLNTLIFNLYPGNKGFSWGIRLPEGEQETIKYPYSQEEMLLCLDREELPYMMLDLLEEKRSDLFYSGCIIAEVRDHRRGFTLNRYTITYVLLKPTTMSLIRDLNVLTRNSDFTREERLQLESQLVLATQEPLCLDPSPAVALSSNRLQYECQPFNTKNLRSTARRFTQVALNRKRKLDQFTAHPELKLHSFLSRQPSKPKPTTAPVPRKVPLDLVPLSADIAPDVTRLARIYERPRETSDCTPHLVEEYVLEADRGQGKCYHIKVTILQRAADGQFLGELYVDRDFKEGESNGSACRFPLGTRAHANRYIHQFTEIFTEEGRKSVRITHSVPGQPTRVTCTAGMREREAKLQAQALLKAQSMQPPPPHIPSLLSPPTVMTNGSVASPKSPTLSSPRTPNASPRHMTNPTISAIVTSLMNSAQQFQQATAAAHATVSPSMNPPQVTANNCNNSAILSILNNTSLNHQHQPKPLAKKLVISDLYNHRTPVPQFTISTNSAGFTTITPGNNVGYPIATKPGGNNMCFTSVPIAAKPHVNNTGFTAVPITSKPPSNNVGYTTVPIASKPVRHTNHIRQASIARRASGGDAANSHGLSMPGLSALLAGTPSADNPIPGNSNSSLLDRLTAASVTSSPGHPPSPHSPAASPTGSNLRLNCIESLQGAITSIPGLQNVHVSIPGLAVPISVSLNVSTAGGTLVSSTPINHSQSVVLTSTNSGQPIISLPVAQLMTSGMKGLPQQNLRSSLIPNASISLPQVQQIQLQLQRPLNNQHHLVDRKQAITRTLLQRPNFRVAAGNSLLPGSIIGPTSQVVTLTPQQQLQLAAMQKQQLQLQCLNQAQPATVAAKHRRRSNAADPNK